MKTYTLSDVLKLEPCKDPRKFVQEGWSGTVVDIGSLPTVSTDDKIWVITGLLDDSTNRYCAYKLAEMIAEMIGLEGKQVRVAIETLGRYDEVTEYELEDVRDQMQAIAREVAYGSMRSIANGFLVLETSYAYSTIAGAANEVPEDASYIAASCASLAIADFMRHAIMHVAQGIKDTTSIVVLREAAETELQEYARQIVLQNLLKMIVEKGAS